MASYKPDSRGYVVLRALQPTGSINVNGTSFELVNGNGQANELIGAGLGCVLHWQASGRNRLWNDYHVVVTELPDHTVVVVQRCPFTRKGQHIWSRNTGLYGFSWASMNVGHPLQPTLQMREAMAVLVAETCAWKQIDPRATYVAGKREVNADHSKIWVVPGKITVPTIADHQLYAKHDGYYPDRVDIGSLYMPTREGICEHYDKLKRQEVSTWSFKAFFKEA